MSSQTSLQDHFMELTGYKINKPNLDQSAYPTSTTMRIAISDTPRTVASTRLFGHNKAWFPGGHRVEHSTRFQGVGGGSCTVAFHEAGRSSQAGALPSANPSLSPPQMSPRTNGPCLIRVPDMAFPGFKCAGH